MNGSPRLAPVLFAAVATVALTHLAPTTALATPWRFESVDTTVSASVISAIAIDSQGWPHIAYYDAGPGAIRYASRDGMGWTSEFVDSTGAVSPGANRSVSLILDGGDVPHIGYLVRPNPANNNYEFRHAARGSSAWSIETIFAPGAVLDSPVLAQDCVGNLHACVGQVPGPYLMYGNKDAGTWSFTPLGSGQRGWYTSLRVDCSGDVHVCFGYTNSPYGLRYGRRSAGTWAFDTVAAGWASYTSLKLDSQGAPHVAWYSGSLRYGVKTGSGWSLITLDSGANAGLSNSLVLDAADHAHVAYWEGIGYRLRYASDLSGQWVVEQPLLPQPVNNTALDLDGGGAPHISYSYYSGNGSLRYATTAPLITAVGPPGRRPTSSIRLEAAYPNPTARGIDLVLALPSATHVRLDVRDVMGREVRQLANRALAGGRTILPWDGTDARGERAGPGVYWVILDAGGVRVSRRIVLLEGSR